ncbi:efflux RND transporter permease subunit, partial [Stenotrophomonas sp. SrG]|uniref:efflux RND transporter permease subunit n=1 Tax=Stenotrophomonas sp. SrG TaxID=3414430 RepID=UPI003CF72C05
MGRYIIDRPIIAWGISIIIMLAGALAVLKLPVSLYPEVAPPAVEISASYPGASAKVVEDSLTQIIEQNMTCIDGVISFSSNSSANG